MSVPALVLGRGVTALAVIRDLGRQGVPVYVLGAIGNFARASRYGRRHPAAAAGEPEEDRLPAFLERVTDPRLVLIPCSDAWAKAVANLPSTLARRFPASIAADSTIEKCVDKLPFASLLEQERLPHPITREIRGEADLVPVGVEPGATFFLKPRQSQAFALQYSTKAFRVSSRAEAAEKWRQATSDGHALMLQEYIPGPPTEHYFVDGFVDRRGRVCAALARRRLRMFPRQFGNSTCSVSIPIGDVEQAASDVKRLLQALNYRGAFSVELKRDLRDGLFKILELNARPWWYIGFSNYCGVNISRMCYDDALGEPIEIAASYRTGVPCVYLRHDLRAAQRMIGAGEITFREWVSSLRGAFWPIFSWNDPRPYFQDSDKSWRALLRLKAGA